MNKIFSFILLAFLWTSCTRVYRIEGTSSVNMLDGRKLYLKVFREGEMVPIDSSDVVHGTFKMKGETDSVLLATLYMDDVSIMPIVLERGRVTVSITDRELDAKGTPLNAALYDFIRKKNDFEVRIRDLERKETQLLLDGSDYEEVHGALKAKNDSLVEAMNRCIKTFIADNYDNVVGPGIFMMLCSSLPYPIMTPEIDDILKDAPYSFKNNSMVKEFTTKAKENMEIIKEHERMEQQASMRME